MSEVMACHILQRDSSLKALPGPFRKAISIFTLVKQSKSLGLVGAVRVEVQYDKVTRDIHQLPRRAAPVKACHHLVGVAVQKLHHVRLVGDVEKGEVEEEGG